MKEQAMVFWRKLKADLSVKMNNPRCIKFGGISIVVDAYNDKLITNAGGIAYKFSISREHIKDFYMVWGQSIPFESSLLHYFITSSTLTGSLQVQARYSLKEVFKQ